MIIGYCVIVPDIGCDMLSDLELSPCSRYSNIYDINIIDKNFKISKRKNNIMSTYDGYKIVSEKFKLFCETQAYTGLSFVPIPYSQNHYWFKISNVLEFDFEAAGVQFLNYNEECKGYEEIIGAFPVCLKGKETIKDGFFRTDICFGSFAGKSPVYLVGEETMKKLKSAGFKEIFFEEILDVYQWQKEKIQTN